MTGFGKRTASQRTTPFGIWFWIFFLGSIALGWFLAREIWGEWRASRWPKVPCEILASEITQQTVRGNVYYHAQIRFQYELGGRARTSDQIRAKGASSPSEYGANARIVARFPVGAKVECHVNPHNPDDAVLDPRPDYFLPFVAIGPMFIWAVLERVAIGDWLARRRAQKLGKRLPLTEIRTTRRWLQNFLIGLISVVLCGAAAIFLIAYPAWRTMQASDWQPTPCRVIQSRVKTETHHQGWSYKAEIAFSYEVDNRQHVSEQLDFSGDLGTSYADTEASLAGFSAGTTNSCFVNPSNADDAVLRRTFRVNWFLTLFVLAWLGAGSYLIASALLVRFEPMQSALPWETARGRSLAAKPSLNLKPAQNALLMFMLCLAGGLACVVLALWLGLSVVKSLGRGGFDLLPALYAGASLFGVVQAAVRGRRFWQNIRNPSPLLAICPAMPVAGEKFSVAWLWRQGANSARPFRLWLQGTEEARVLKTSATPHGPSREEKLEKCRFAARLLAELPAEPSGLREFTLPSDVMPSFESVKARVLWHLCVKVSAPGGAGDHEHKIIIRPPES